MKRGWVWAVCAGVVLGLGLGCGGGGDKAVLPSQKFDAPKEKPVPIGMKPKAE